MNRGRAGAAALAITALATVAACGTAPTGPPPATPAPGATSLRLYEHDTGQATVDLGSPGGGPGDLFVFTGDVRDGGPQGAPLGRADGSCTTTSGTPTAPGKLLCQISFTLRDGQLQTQAVYDSGTFFSGAPAALAVTGGTGTYRSARGDGTATVPDVADSSSVLFQLAVEPRA